MWNTVLFDLDGTLTDSSEGIMKCVQYATEKALGFTETREDVLKSFIGPPLTTSFMKYDGVTEEDAKRAIKVYRERYQVTGIYENKLYPGIKEMLCALKEKGYKVGLASSKPELYCRQILGFFQIAQYFDVIVGAPLNETGAGAEKPQLVEKAIVSLNMENRRDNVVMVGDRSYDIEGAKTCRISSVGVRYGFASAGELERAGADAIVNTVDELKFFLQRQMGNSGSFKGEEYNASHYDQRQNTQNEYMKDQDFLHTESERQGYAQYQRTGRVKLYPFDGGTFRQVLRCAWPAVLALAIEFFIGIVVGALGGVLHISQADIESGTVDLVLSGAMDAIFLIVFGLMLKKDEEIRRNFGARERLLQKQKYSFSDGCLTICAMLAVSFLGDLVLNLLMKENDTYAQYTEQLSHANVFLVLLFVGILPPFAEEVLFRGVFYRRLRDYLGTFWAAGISGIVFGVFHGNLAQGAAAAIMGFALALLYEHFGTLFASVTAHMAVNVFAVVTMHLDTSSSAISLVTLAVVILLAAGVISIYQIFFQSERINRV